MALKRVRLKEMGTFMLEKSTFPGMGACVTFVKVRGEAFLQIRYAKSGKVERFKFQSLSSGTDQKKQLDYVNQRAARANEEARGHGALFSPLSDEEREAVSLFRNLKAECLRSGSPFASVSLSQLVRESFELASASSNAPPFQNAAAEFLDFQAQQGLSSRYIEQLNLRFKRFVCAFGKMPVTAVTPDAVSQFLTTMVRPDGRQVALDTVLDYRRSLHAFFEWLLKRDVVVKNPVAAAHNPKRAPRAPEFFSLRQTRAVLEASLECCPEALPAFVLGLFCGLRPESEIVRLTCDRVDPVKRCVTIRSEGKLKVGRVVSLPDNAVCWLERAGFQSAPGRFVLEGDSELKRKGALRRARQMVMARAGLVSWPKDGMRHSFATYSYAKDDNVHSLAKAMGHSKGINTLLTHYVNLVSPQEGEAFFEIVPAT